MENPDAGWAIKSLAGQLDKFSAERKRIADTLPDVEDKYKEIGISIGYRLAAEMLKDLIKVYVK